METHFDSPSLMSRRRFLQFAGAMLIPTSIFEGVNNLATNNDKLANFLLQGEIKLGGFSPEKTGSIPTVIALKDHLQSNAEQLKGISKCQVLIADGSNTQEVSHQVDSDIFMPASTIKVPLCYESWKLGEQRRETYLTPELAHDILEKSYTFVDLLMKTPYAQGKKPEQLEEIVRAILINAKIPPQNLEGMLPLKVNIRDQFQYLQQMELPPIMREAMLQRADQWQQNYGVSTVLHQHLGNKTPSYFKIGLVYDETKPKKELVNSYYFQIGDTLKVLGYTQGSDYYEVHKQMLQTAAALGSYSKTSVTS